MEGRAYTVEDATVDELSSAIASRLEPEYQSGGRGFEVLVAEEYEFWRTNSNMQVTVVVDGTRADCRVEVLVGGGAAGILKFTAGSETKVLRWVTDAVEEAFDELGADVTAVEDVREAVR